MFKNRKKSSAKRPDEHRDRDNSRVLCTDTDTAASHLPFRRESLSTGNFQYLKLTDGFNIVLTSDTGDSQSASSPDHSPSPKSRQTALKNDGNGKQTAGIIETEYKPATDVLTETERGQVSPSSRNKRGGAGIARASDSRIDSSTTRNTESSKPVFDNPPCKSPTVSLVSLAFPETAELPPDASQTRSPAKPSPECSSQAVPSHTPRKEPSVKLDADHTTSECPVPGWGSDGQQTDGRIDAAGDLTSMTTEGTKGVPGTEGSTDKQKSLCAESGCGASNNTNRSSLFSPLERETHAEEKHWACGPCDNTAQGQSHSPMSASAAESDDKELNKPNEQINASPVASSGEHPDFEPPSPHHKCRSILDTETTVTQSRLEQTDVDAEDSSSCQAHPQGDSEARPPHGEDVSVAEASHNEDANTGHENTTDINRSRHTGLKDSLIGLGKKKASANISGDVSESGKKHSVADMFRLNRHAPHTKNTPGEQPAAVYRKLGDEEKTEATQHHRNPADQEHPEATDDQKTATDAAEIPASQSLLDTRQAPPTHSPQQHSQLKTEPTEQPHPPDHSPPLPHPKPHWTALPNPVKKLPARVYENWTINQAVTQKHAHLDVDDDDDDSENLSPGSSLGRQSAQGSRDSGLCVDVHSTAVVAAGEEEEAACGGGDDEVEETCAGDGRGGEEGIHHSEEEEEEEGGGGGGKGPEGGGVDTSGVSDVEGGSAIYENTAIPPRRQQDDGDSAGTPEGTPPQHTPPQGLDSPGTPRVAAAILASSGRHHDSHSLTSTASEDHSSSRHNLSTSGDSSLDEGEEEEDSPLATAARENMLKMRHLLVKGVLETEKTYLAILELLLHYKRTVEASCRTSKPVISEDDAVTIFSNLPALRDTHKGFVEGLQGKVQAWGPLQTVGDVFMGLVEKFPQFGAYAENYQTAVATIHRCSQDNDRFQDLAQQIVLTSTTREVTSLEDALFKPVQRLQRNTLVLYDLIKHTPKDHPDHESLHTALQLSQKNLENFGTSLVPRHKVEQKGHLVKSSFLVELVGASRKLRYVFVFSEMLVCTKREQENRSGEVTFDCKWFIPMNVLQLDTKFSYQDDIKFSKRDEIEDLKRKLRIVKTEIKKELKKEDTKEKQRPTHSLVPSRTVEKLQRKANELEGQLILASPRLPFKVWHDSGKAHTFLMTTDYEREEWRELLSSLQKQSTTETDLASPSAFTVQEMVNSVIGVPEVNEIGSVLIETEEEVIYGTLNVTVHKLTGLTQPCDTYCCIEMDSYGHFFMKAKTHISSSTIEPSWNADFELDLEGSQTLRVLCYKKGPDKQGDILLGRSSLEMTKSWLKGTFQERIITMNEYSLVLSICYTETEKTLRRTPVRQSGTAVFGVQICACATREGRTVPTIVTACVQEVERRGMKETGIYRVSGVTSDVQRLKKYFDKNLKMGTSSLSEVDIHTVTSLVKLYLRELPDPVFTEASYPNFLDALKLNDKEGKEKCMLSLFYNLPDINYYTAVYILEHLLRVTRYESENKMSIHNLSTIFGPTLLAPAPEKMTVSVMELMTVGAEHCMKQSQVIHFYLALLVRGASLRRSSAGSSASAAGGGGGGVGVGGQC
ncbi:uncharacterized protein LOC143288590 [Babylonia areolata]|uniref:uncharacterized protein LOC143288590 n=1 Tax=Babylonia areolata TaxID=304850 RepID=UPI003FD1FE36